MGDDLSRAVGNLEGRFDSLEEMLRDQNTDRRAMHDENKRLWSETHAVATRNASWIEEKGDPMHKAWIATEKRKQDRRAENRGRLKTWAYITTAATTAIGTLGFLGKEAIAAILKRIGEALS
jgi:hypothetical protein